MQQLRLENSITPVAVKVKLRVRLWETISVVCVSKSQSAGLPLSGRNHCLLMVVRPTRTSAGRRQLFRRDERRRADEFPHIFI